MRRWSEGNLIGGGDLEKDGVWFVGVADGERMPRR